MVVAGMALFGSVLMGANSLFEKVLHAGQPKVQVVQGSFGTPSQARDVYQGVSSVTVLDGNGQQLQAH